MSVFRTHLPPRKTDIPVCPTDHRHSCLSHIFRLCKRSVKDLCLSFMKTALVILAEGFEEIEAITVIDILRRADVACTVAAQHDGKFVTGKTGIQVVADELLNAVRDQSFDLVVLPGGPGARHLRKDQTVLELARRQAAAGACLAAICAAPTVLLQAGVLEGRKYTAHPSVHSELPETIADQAVVWDENIATSRGAGTAVDFALSLVARLCGAEKSEEIRDAICAPGK